MDNVYQLKKAKITKVITENFNTKTLFFELEDQSEFRFLAGQFMMVGLPGFGECAISISSNPKESEKGFSLTIRAVGELTEKLLMLGRADFAYVRGPFGNGFPEVTGNLILIGGGCGFIPLRSVYEENKKRKDIKIQLFVGCKNEKSLVFKRDLVKAKSRHDLRLILEEKTLPCLPGRQAPLSSRKGFITDLIKTVPLLPNATILICGPEIMYKYVVLELLKKNVPANKIYLSLEKRMYCGVGVCQHCAIGSRYVCKDGPVFAYEFLQTVAQYKY